MVQEENLRKKESILFGSDNTKEFCEGLIELIEINDDEKELPNDMFERVINNHRVKVEDLCPG